MSASALVQGIAEAALVRHTAEVSTERQVFVVCSGDSCKGAGANRLLGLLRRECHGHSGKRDVRVSSSKCLGHCALAPAMVNNGRVLGWVSLRRLKSELSRLGLFSLAASVPPEA